MACILSVIVFVAFAFVDGCFARCWFVRRRYEMQALSSAERHQPELTRASSMDGRMDVQRTDEKNEILDLRSQDHTHHAPPPP